MDWTSPKCCTEHQPSPCSPQLSRSACPVHFFLLLSLSFSLSTGFLAASFPLFLVFCSLFCSPFLCSSPSHQFSSLLSPSFVKESESRSKKDDVGYVILSSLLRVILAGITNTHTHILTFYYICFSFFSHPSIILHISSSWYYIYSHCGMSVLRGQLQDSHSGFKFHFHLSLDTVYTERCSGGGKHASRANISPQFTDFPLQFLFHFHIITKPFSLFPAMIAGVA